MQFRVLIPHRQLATAGYAEERTLDENFSDIFFAAAGRPRLGHGRQQLENRSSTKDTGEIVTFGLLRDF